MKKKIIIAVIIVVSSLSSANAQGLLSVLKTRLDMGVKAEANYSGFVISDLPNSKSTMQPGVNVGTFIKFNISNHFAILEDILFTYSSSKITVNGVEDKYEAFGTQVPIYLMGQWKNLIGGQFYAGLGVYFGLGFSAKMKDSDINLYKKYNGDNAYLKRLTNGFAAQMGYEFKNKFQINASYKIGMNALDANKKDFKMLPQTISLGIGYKF